MTTAFQNTTPVDNVYSVSVARSTDPMGNQQSGLLLSQALQLTQNMFFGFGGLEPPVLDPYPTLTNQCVQLFWKVADGVFQIRRGGGIPDAFQGTFRVVVSDVVF